MIFHLFFYFFDSYRSSKFQPPGLNALKIHTGSLLHNSNVDNEFHAKPQIIIFYYSEHFYFQPISKMENSQEVEEKF